jgi:hypothetical protein
LRSQIFEEDAAFHYAVMAIPARRLVPLLLEEDVNVKRLHPAQVAITPGTASISVGRFFSVSRMRALGETGLALSGAKVGDIPREAGAEDHHSTETFAARQRLSLWLGDPEQWLHRRAGGIP